MDSFRVLTGSRLYGYHTEDSDMDIKGVYILPLEERLNPLGFKDQSKEESHIQIDNSEFPLGTKQEITSQELTTFLRQLWKGDINAWEVLWSHRVFLTSSVHKRIKANHYLFYRPNVLRHNALRMIRNHYARAVEEQNGKTAAHALKHGILLLRLLDGREEPTRFSDFDRLFIQSVRNHFDYPFTQNLWKRRMEIVLQNIERINLAKDSETISQDALAFTASIYEAL